MVNEGADADIVEVNNRVSRSASMLDGAMKVELLRGLGSSLTLSFSFSFLSFPFSLLSFPPPPKKPFFWCSLSL